MAIDAFYRNPTALLYALSFVTNDLMARIKQSVDGGHFIVEATMRRIANVAAVSIDFIECLPKSFEKDVIMVVVDMLSKYAHFITLAHLFITIIVAQAYLDNVYKLHGVPNTIIFDRDRIFTNSF
ncbi:uncharacterized protein LOC111284482 [Durio zibethinus]|uniref:Uncharacterized protein LOC111284482 n=1 Tax=Durio zibethinus TaxID=66656 RepID=A0A6P5XKG1_DURZI|nr:uncharacterized protein LOC111284482 [Durio zibethinus]